MLKNMMRTWSRFFLFKAIVLSTVGLFFTESYSSKMKALAFDKNITRSLIFRPTTRQTQELIKYTVSD